MLEQFKKYYYKDDFDYSKGYVDPFEFHSTFYKTLVLFKVADLKNKHPPSILNQNAVICIVMSMAVILTTCSFCHGVDSFDKSLMTEAGTYTMVLLYAVLIISCTRRNLPQYHNFILTMKADFQYICTTGEKYRKPYFENQLTTWKIYIITLVFTVVIAVGMLLSAFLALFYHLLTTKPGDGKVRPLLFPFWLPDVDFGQSPVYETAFMFSNACIIIYDYNYVFMLTTQIVWIRQITSKVDIVNWSLRDLLVDIHPPNNQEQRVFNRHIIQTRLREIIIHNHSMYSLMQDYAIVYKKLLMFEQVCCGPVVCLTAYCVAEKLDEGEFQAILLLLCVATIVLHFIPSYLCTFLGLKVRSTCDACWDIPFWNADPVIRPYLVLLMQRSLRSLPLQAAGFEDISVATFSKKMTSAYSYFNMLRQTNL